MGVVKLMLQAKFFIKFNATRRQYFYSRSLDDRIVVKGVTYSEVEEFVRDCYAKQAVNKVTES